MIGGVKWRRLCHNTALLPGRVALVGPVYAFSA